MRSLLPRPDPRTTVKLGVTKRRFLHQDIPFLSQTFVLNPAEYNRHFHYLGVSGSGKSTAIATVIVQHILQGRGVSLIDPHGDLAVLVMKLLADRGYFQRDEDYDRIRYFDFGHPDRVPPMNVLNQPDEDNDNVASALAAVCLRIWPNLDTVGVTFLNIIKNAAYALVEAGLPLPAMQPFLEEPAFREMVLGHATDPHIGRFFTNRFNRWRDQTEKIESTQNRLDLFTFSPRMRAMFGERENIVPYGQIMQEGKSAIYNLSALDEEKNNFVAAFLFYGYERAAHCRAAIEEDDRVHHYLFADEFQNFTTKNGKSFGDMLSGVRKYRLNLSLANQNYGQIDERIKQALGNAEMIAFKLNRDDAVWMAPRLNPFDEHKVKHRIEDKTLQDRSHPLFASVQEQFEKTARELERLGRGHCYVQLGSRVRRIVTTPFPKPTISREAFSQITERYAQQYLKPFDREAENTRKPTTDSVPVPVFEQPRFKRRTRKSTNHPARTHD